MGKVLLIIISLFSFSSFACEETNLFKSHPVINDLEIINQGNLNICYAHTLSTVYNLEFGAREQDRLDPFWVAFTHKSKGLHWQPQKLDYSMASLAWADVKKSGYCDPQIIRTRFDELKNGVEYSDSQLLFLLAHFFKTKTWFTTRTDIAFYRAVTTLLIRLPKVSKDRFEVPWTRDDLNRVLYPLRKSVQGFDFFPWMNRKVFNGCASAISHKPTQMLTSTARNNESNDELHGKVLSYLKKNKPLSLGYCSKIYSDPKVNITAMPRVLKAINSKCGAHYSTIVGTRKVGAKCEYLIRNSYGKGFWAHSDFTCYCREKSTGLERNCGKHESENADLEVLGCWIGSDKLLTNSFDLSYFK